MPWSDSDLALVCILRRSLARQPVLADAAGKGGLL
jgi:hypothetical protein